jgi:glycosyltransferase involved in cell wall biosynthesis
MRSPPETARSVLFIATYSPLAVSGVGQFMIDLGTRLVTSGYAVGMCYRSEAPEAPLPGRIAAARLLEVSAQGVRTPGFLWRTARALFRARRDYEVFHVILPQPMTALAAFLARVFGRRVVATVFAPYPRKPNLAAEVLQRTAEWLVLRLAHVVAYESAETRRHFHVPGPVILNGIDTEYFRPDEGVRRALRAEAGYGPEDVVILYLGRITRTKGVHDLLSAVGHLPPTTRARLLLVGPVGDEMLFGSAAPLPANVRLVGPVGKDEVLPYYRLADILVLPSYREGISSSLIEGMACGLPAVVSRVGGNAEVVADGESGYLHPPGDVEALRGHLATLLEDPDLRRSLGEGGRRAVLARFTMDSMAGGYLAAYQEDVT